MNDSQLVKECLKGKQESQKRLYEQFAAKMLGVCMRYASSREEAEDFLQEAFITIFRKLHQYKGEGELGGWIRRIVVNTSLNGLKVRHRFTENMNIIPIENISGNESFIPASTEKELMELVSELPIGCRTVFNLYIIEGYSHEEIAAMLNINAGTSRSQLTRARRMLMQKLEDDSVRNNEQHG